LNIKNNQPELGMTKGGLQATVRRPRCWTLSLSAGLTLCGAVNIGHADPTLPALNSYGQPPFLPVSAERNSGLARTFVDLVNKATSGRPEFQLDNLPRKRLELTLTNRSFSGVALFLAPEFLVQTAQQGAVWSDPVMVDENLIVSVRQLNVASLEELHGLRLGGIAGHIYRLLGPAIEDGKVHREDAPDHISNLKKLCLGRVDFVVISRSELAGSQPHVSCAEPFRPNAFPEPQVIVRRVLVRMPNDNDAKEVLDAVASVACGPQWSQTLAQYGLSTVGCRNTATKSVEPANGRKGRVKGRRDNLTEATKGA
jgi:polar amino acid transport system substrate-binding protein